MFKPDYSQQFSKSFSLGEKEIKVTIGKFAQQATSAILIECGGTSVLTTIVMGKKSNLDYFPLQVEFNEKLYAGGIIKGSRWVKRDFRSSEDAVLISRLIDRSIRPLFPDGLKNEVQIINNVFSFDKENEADMLGLLATGLGLTISKIPFFGPLAGLRLGYIKEEKKFLINPTVSQKKISDLDLIVSGGQDSIVMVEAGASEIEESLMIEALGKAQAEINHLCQIIEEVKMEIGHEKISFEVENIGSQEKLDLIKKYFVKKLDLIDLIKKEGNFEEIHWDEIYQTALEVLVVSDATILKEDLKFVLSDLIKKTVRERILNDGIRPDGRKTTEIRPINCEIDLFDRNHGSAMFKRGATQVVTITTLGSPSLGQYIEDMGGEEIRHYMHHYNMLPFASGETGRVGYPKRREIGHGALAERALYPVIPSQTEFPYTIHMVSEVLSSNGSTSQASVCGSTLSLMSAGVPIKRPVAGIAMGLIIDGEKYQILSDIKDVEDHFGDMDFKVAGTEQGITALQMDIKVKGISLEILRKALNQAKDGRKFILDKMLAVIDKPRIELSPFAPKVRRIDIPVIKIGELIGPGGKIIKSIIEKSGAEINIDEDEEKKVGVVCISSSDQKCIDLAVTLIEGYLREVVVNNEFDGKVTRVENYGVFVSLVANKEGLLHISSMGKGFVRDAAEIYKVGDELHVRVSEIQDDGKIKLSMLSESEEKEKQMQNNQNRRSGGRDFRSNKSDDRKQGFSKFKRY